MALFINTNYFIWLKLIILSEVNGTSCAREAAPLPDRRCHGNGAKFALHTVMASLAYQGFELFLRKTEN